MFRYCTSYAVLMFVSLPGLFAQQGPAELSFEESARMLRQHNQSIMIADKEIDWAKTERQRLNALWYPNISAAGAYTYMSNPIEVKEPLSQFTDPAKDFVHSIIPNDQLISSILDNIGARSLTFPLAPQGLATIDANVVWPVFVGGKRIYADRIGKTMISIAEESRGQIDAAAQTALVEAYYGLRLNQLIVEVRRQTYGALEKHYQNALKLEATGMIDKAERLFAQVNMDEAARELSAAQNNLIVAQGALKTLIGMDDSREIRPVSSLFINDNLPSLTYFKSYVGDNNYIVNQLKLQAQIAESQLKIGHSEYLPDIALFGKHTLYSHGIQKNLLPRSMVGVGFTWNLFDGLGREKKIRQAKISMQTVALTREKTIDQLDIAVDKLYAQLQNALGSVTALSTTIELSKELVRMRRKAFAEGMATSTEVVDAEVMLSKVQIASLLAYFEYDVALINLLSVCGVPDTFQKYGQSGKDENYIFN